MTADADADRHADRLADIPADVHYYEPRNGHGLPHDPFNAIVGPRPIGWISSRSAAGVLNLAPYSFFNAFNYTPPILGFSSTSRKDSVENIEATGEFAWNLVTKDLAQAMNQTSAAVPADVDEFALAGLQTVASRLIDVPRVARSPVSMECKLLKVIQLNDLEGNAVDTWLVLGQVVGVHINRALLKNGIYDTAAAYPILRAGGPGGYAQISPEVMFDMRRPK